MFFGGGTDVRELTRGLETLPQKVDPGAFSGQRQGWKTPQEDPLAVHCFCVCSGSALSGDLLGVSRSRECDLLSVLLIYPRIFLRAFIAYRLLVGFLYMWLFSAICSCVLVILVKLSVLAKWLAIERPLWWHLHEVRRLSPQSSGGRACFCVFFFCLVCLCCSVSPPRPTQYTFHTPMARYGMCWKCR